MKNLRQHIHRSGRSNMYSQSKCSNWAAFSPYLGEIGQIRNNQEPTTKIVLSDEVKIEVLERPLHEAFLRPYTIKDIEDTLASVPLKFLVGSPWILLLGGTKKQEQRVKANVYFGQYYCHRKMIVLCAFPKKLLRLSAQIQPHWIQGYIRAGATCRQEGQHTIVEFNEQSLKTFYLRDVLIHEIGHHVDWIHRQRCTEEFAEWFATEYGYQYQP